MRKPPSRVSVVTALCLAFLACAAVLTVARPARAFCGFYVSDVDQKLYNNATMVVLMRDGQRTVLSMQNNYQGPAEKFAMVVPVPQVLHKENVRTLPREVFDKVDRLASPRLVEYWEQDPCSALVGLEGGKGQGFGNGHGRLGGASTGGEATVRIEARFEVGEYDVVVLSAGDSSGLDAWLRHAGYHIPDGAEPVLRPYVEAGMKFFVAKVDPAKVHFENGQAMLSPLRFYYDTDTFSLPVRLGLLNSAGTQDLLVHILAKHQRYEVANYPNVTVPTNLDVAESARASFPEFYASLFDATVAKNPRAVVTEYAWSTGTCDPCPSPPLDTADLATLGEDVLDGNDGGVSTTVRTGNPSIRQGKTDVTGALPPEVIQRIVRQNFGRVRLCYENGLRTNPSLSGTAAVGFTIAADGSVTGAKDAGSTLPDAAAVACIVRGFGNLSFPQPEKGTVSVVYRLDLSPVGGMTPMFGRGTANDVVLTRLHVRYGKDSLGEDLVFRAAGPIVGGREQRDEQGVLEHGSKADTLNNFQGRYAIRHAWTGSLACEKPVRGIWGGPPGGVSGGGAGGSNPIAAQKTAFAPRGHMQLASMVLQAVPELGLAAPAGLIAPSSLGAAAGDAAPADAGASPRTEEMPVPPAPPAVHSRCSAAPGAPGSPLAVLVAAGVLGVAVTRRRRRLVA